MAYQLGYPPDTEIGGCTVQIYRDVLGQLIAWALQARDRGEVTAPQSEHSLVAALASALAVDPAVIGQAVAAFTLDRENAAYHAAVPGVAAAPLVRVDPSRLVWSVHGLTTEPLLFLSRELKRRAAQEYHNTAYLRETVFRHDLYALFQDKRFVTSAGRIELTERTWRRSHRHRRRRFRSEVRHPRLLRVEVAGPLRPFDRRTGAPARQRPLCQPPGLRRARLAKPAWRRRTPRSCRHPNRQDISSAQGLSLRAWPLPGSLQ